MAETVKHERDMTYILKLVEEQRIDESEEIPSKEHTIASSTSEYAKTEDKPKDLVPKS